MDCLLKGGAKKIYAIDTGYGELDWNLRNNSKVAVMERTNAMHVKLPELADLITIDVSWTKQKNILPNAFKNLKNGGRVISLIKLHYEAPKHYLRKGKLMEEKVDEILEIVKQEINESGGRINKIVESPLLGGKGRNKEFLALIRD